MTKSDVKALNNSVKIIVDKQEYWEQLGEVAVNGIKLKEIFRVISNDIENLQKEDDNLEKNIKTSAQEIDELKQEIKDLNAKLETYKNNLEKIVKGMLKK